MKHLKQLAYKVIQWELKKVLVIGSVPGASVWLITGKWWWYPISLVTIFLMAMYAEHVDSKN